MVVVVVVVAVVVVVVVVVVVEVVMVVVVVWWWWWCIARTFANLHIVMETVLGVQVNVKRLSTQHHYCNRGLYKKNMHWYRVDVTITATVTTITTSPYWLRTAAVVVAAEGLVLLHI